MKNYYKEYTEFVKKQLELNKNLDLNKSWDGWMTLYMIHKLEE